MSQLFKTFSSIFILLTFYYIYAQYRFLPFQLLYLESDFLSIGYLTAANLVRLVISVHCLVSGRSQYLVRLLSLCPITGGHTIYPHVEGLNNQRGFNPHRSEIQPPIYFIYLFISSLFMVDLHLAYKKPINVNNNTAYISVNKLASNNDNNKTKCLIARQNQHVANRLYITYMGNQASTFLCFIWKILDYYNFWLFRGKVLIFLELCKIWSRYLILKNLDFYFEERFVS